MRSGQGNYYPIVQVLELGTSFATIETAPGWVNIMLEDGETGWISSNSLTSPEGTGRTEMPDSSKVASLKLSVDRTALGAMIKGLSIQTGVDDSGIHPLDMNRKVNPVTVRTFRSTMSSQNIGRPASVNQTGADMMPMYLAISPVLAAEQIAAWGGGQTDRESYGSQILLWIMDCAGITDLAPSVNIGVNGADVYCFPGGYITVGGALYDLIEDEAELAAVIAHELAHEVLKHGQKSLAKEAWRIGVSSAFDELGAETGMDEEPDLSSLEDYAASIRLVSKRISTDVKNELQADSCAVVWLVRSGYDPSAIRTFLITLRTRLGDDLTGQDNLNLSTIYARKDLDLRIKTLKKQLKDYKKQVKKGERFKERFEDDGVSIYAVSSEDQIKQSDKYLWGESVGSEMNKVRESADQDLMSKIQVAISASQTHQVNERNTSGESEFVDQFLKQVKSYTGLYLRGLDHLIFNEDDNCRVISYIPKDSLEASFVQRKGKILDMYELSADAEKEQRIGDALRGYYWTFLLAHTYPYTIAFDSTDCVEKDPQVFLSDKIRRIISGIEVKGGACSREADVMVAPVTFSYREQPVKNLQFTYYCGEGSNYGFVENGQTEELCLYDQPETSSLSVVLTLEYAYTHEMKQDPEIVALYEIFRDKSMTATKSVKLEIPWMMDKTQDKPQQTAHAKLPELSLTLKVIADCPDKTILLRTLDRYLQLHRILVGERKLDVEGDGKVFIAILDDTESVKILCADRDKFIDVNSGEVYRELTESFSGKRVVWFSEVGK